MKLIETKTLTSSSTSIEFFSIPQGFTDLVCLLSARAARTDDVQEGINVTFNNLALVYSERALFGTGSGLGTTFATDNVGNFRFSVYSASQLTTANVFSNSQMYISNYSGSTNKNINVDNVIENNAQTTLLNIQSGFLLDTSPIISIKFNATSATGFLSGTTISLYGITKGSDGLTVVS